MREVIELERKIHDFTECYQHDYFTVCTCCLICDAPGLDRLINTGKLDESHSEHE